MTTQEIADRLVALCREGKYEQCYDELFAENAVAQEPEFVPEGRVEGLANLRAKSKAFGENVEAMYDTFAGDPIVAGNVFACTMGMDVKMRGQERRKEEEICMYEVQDGKIVREQFFYSAPPDMG